jgi:hypothetical protein
MSHLIYSVTQSLRFWEGVEFIGALAVILGVIGECIADFTNFPRTATRKKRFEKVAALLLIAGLAFELIGGRQASRLNDVAMQRLNQEAANARERAARLEQRAEEERSARASLELETANARERAARLEKVTEDERMARVKLQEEVANRDFTSQVLKSLAAKLSKYADQAAVIDVFPVTFEHAWLAGAIFGFLVDARWDLRSINYLKEPATFLGPFGSPYPVLVQGIQIQATADERSQTAARALFEALKTTVSPGIFSPVPLPDPHHPRVWIYVGDKPTPLRSWVR